MAQVTRWCFTLNNYVETPNHYKVHFSNEAFQIKRAVWGKEVAPNTRTKHLQGYLEMRRSFRLAYMKTILPTAHFEKAIRSGLINFKYCIKDGDYEVLGDWSKELGQQNSSPATPGMVVYGLLSNQSLKVNIIVYLYIYVIMLFIS